MKFFQKAKDKVIKTVQNIAPNIPKPKVNAIVGNVQQAMTQGAQGVAIAPLIPYFPLMKAIMKKHNVQIPRNNEELVRSFYQNIIKKGIKNDSIDPVTITLIVSAVLSFFMSVKKKRDEQKANAEEKQIAEKTDEIQTVAETMQDVGQGLVTAGNSMNPNSIGTIFNSIPQPVLWGFILFVVYVVYKKMN
jgi:predicted PurR-regulated permease PerM